MYCTRCGSLNPDEVRFCGSCGSPLGPAAAGAAPVATSPLVRYAGFWRRFVAVIIDSLVFTPLLIVFVLGSGVMGAVMQTGSHPEEVVGALFGLAFFAYLLVVAAGSWLYHTWMESSRYQATLGKMALGIVVTDLNGNRISFARANGRYFGKWISGMILNIGYLMAAFTEKKQALHDMLASCLVVVK